MAKSTQERSAKSAEKARKFDEKELRHKVRPGIHQAMDRIRERSGVTEISEIMQTAILKMDAMDDAELIEFLTIPRHKIEISETWRDKFDNESRREAMKDPGDEIIQPDRLPHGPDECAKAQLDILGKE